MSLPPPTFLFLLHTYLVGTWAITKAFGYDLSPALHIAEAKVIELPSGISLAQFLMVFLTLEAHFSSMLLPRAVHRRRVTVKVLLIAHAAF